MKHIPYLKIELPEFYNVACHKADDKGCQYTYQYTFRVHLLKVPKEDNGRNVLKEDGKYFTWNFN